MTFRYAVTAVLNSDSSVQELSKIFEGLERLRRRGVVRYSVQSSGSASGWSTVILLGVRASSGADRTVAIDLMDQAELIDFESLQLADLYFKRSFNPRKLQNLAPELARKLRPFGLNNPAISTSAAIRVLTSRTRAVHSIRGLAADARQLLALPPQTAFERAPNQRTEPLVLFQTRLWDSEEPDVAAINEQRIQLVLTLRRALGRHFIGGVLPIGSTARRNRHVLTTLPYGMRAYPALVRRALVGVYSVGLHRSIAFKLSEYLAASCCVVADSFDAALPAPFTEEDHFLHFEDAVQCAAMCDRLLSSPAEANEMRWRNWDYYRATVEPGAQMMGVLNELFLDCTEVPTAC